MYQSVAMCYEHIFFYFYTKIIKLKSSIINILFFAISFIFFNQKISAQEKVGLVLSGGGATGLAHIGVLKALEENNIPIDYITGTSAGALIGALYASGYSPNEIEAFALSEEFQLLSKGKNLTEQNFLLKKNEPNASMASINFSLKEPLSKSIPTNIISSDFLDFEMFKMLGPSSAIANNNFDSLFIPFRCVASDITNKESVIFRKGNLNETVRASITFPFYISPISIDGKILFDGGLYNNFPSNVLYEEFDVDYIIGSNVSYNAAPPTEDDLIGQLINMLVFHSDFSLPCDNGIIIQPNTKVTTFEFEEVQKAIDEGYQATLKDIQKIKENVHKRIIKEDLIQKRDSFKAKTYNLKINSIKNETKSGKSSFYVQRSMFRPKKDSILSFQEIEKRYYRLYQSEQIDFIHPTLKKKNDNSYSLNLNVRKAKEFKLDVGGHFSSRSVNTGYLGLQYKNIGKTAYSIDANSYFGKFYGSIKNELKFEIPSSYPFTISSYIVLNRWDYFRNFSTFFETVKPSFLIQNEIYSGLKLEHPIKNNQKSIFDFRYFENEDDYYQTENFSSKDTTDKTCFNGMNLSWELIQNSLNRKQFANSGHLFKFKIKFIKGLERSISGTTSNNVPFDIRKNHSWLSINSEIQSFIIDHDYIHLGIYGKGVYTSQSLFANYTSSMLQLTSFSPIPDVETYFLPEYRSPQHIGAGLNLIFSPNKNLDLRIDAYYYQPFKILVKNNDIDFGYSKLFKGNKFLGSSSIIYHSLVGPLRLTLNYFPDQPTPLNFQFSFGYVLFNDRSFR